MTINVPTWANEFDGNLYWGDYASSTVWAKAEQIISEDENGNILQYWKPLHRDGELAWELVDAENGIFKLHWSME